MLVLTKKPTTKGFADICLLVPARDAKRISTAIEKFLALAGMRVQEQDSGDDESLPIEQAFPNLHQGSAIRGLRSREGLSQAKLAELIGVKQHHISEMEHGKRPIGRETAKRLAKALRTGYKVFL